MIVNEGKRNEVAVRVVLESEVFGREYFDYGSLERCMGGLIRIVQDAIECAAEDGVERVVGIAIIPRSEYGDESGYYPEYEDEDIGDDAHIADEPTTEGVAAMEVLARLAKVDAAAPAAKDDKEATPPAVIPDAYNDCEGPTLRSLMTRSSGPSADSISGLGVGLPADRLGSGVEI